MAQVHSLITLATKRSTTNSSLKWHFLSNKFLNVEFRKGEAGGSAFFILYLYSLVETGLKE
jgi:hypothetical protein